MGEQGDMERVTEVYGCVVLEQFAAQALPAVRASEAATVVMDGVKPWEMVYAVNGPAHRLGIRTGMTRVEVETFGAEMVRRSEIEERAATTAVLGCLASFSPRVEARARAGTAWEAVLDLSGTERLLGESQDVGDALLERLAGLGFYASLVVAGNADAGLSLARFGAARFGAGRAAGRALRCRVVQTAELGGALRNLPVGVLRLDDGQADRFEAWGIRTLGELSALREEDLIVRMGQAGKVLWARARGEFQEMLQPVLELLRLEASAEFDDALETLDQVLFCLNPMLEGLLARAGERALAVATLDVLMTLQICADRVEGDLEERPPEVFQRRVQPAVATLDRALLLKLIQLDLEAHPVPGAIVRVELRAEAGDPSRIQLGLFAPQMPEPTRFEDTYARLSAVVGETNVGRLCALDTYARERFRLERFRLPTGVGKAAAPREDKAAPAMALRRIRPPAEVKVWTVNRQIERFVFEAAQYQVTRCYGPWRTSGEWWGQEAWSYDAWDVVARTGNGEVMLCVMGFDLLRKRWQMEGIYD